MTVFHASLGNIKPASELEFRIPFVLIAGDNQASAGPAFDGVASRHEMPSTGSSIAVLNRGNPTKHADSSNVPEHTGTVGLPEYPVSINLGSPARGGPTGNFWLSEGSIYPHESLEKEVVITVSPRKPEEMEDVCILTEVLRPAPPLLPAQEYLFLVDRSGSMYGSRIAQVRSALKIMLASLPNPPIVTSFVSRHLVYD